MHVKDLYLVPFLFCVAAVNIPGQNIGASSAWSWDQSTGNVYVYAQTTADYSSAYYYDACAATILDVYPASGGAIGYGGPFDCVNGSGGPIDAESSYSTTITTEPSELDFQSYHEVDATYADYQFDPYCSYDCDYWWDAYELSYLGASNITYPDNTSWFAPGSPGVGVPQQETMTVYIERTQSNTCLFPSGERSIYISKTNPILTGYYAGQYQAQLQINRAPAAAGMLDGRRVAEAIDNYSETCHFSGSAIDPIPKPTAYAWQVKQFIYGIDNIGLGTGTADYYQNAINNQSVSYTSCGWSAIQSMYIDGCGGDSQFYDYGHTIDIKITGSAMTTDRATANGPAK